MKNILFIILLTVLCSACVDDFLDLKPQDEITEVAYFTKAEHFEFSANHFHKGMLSWRNFDGYYMDYGTDLISWVQDYGMGNIVTSENDEYWEETYEKLRDINILLQKAEEYPGDQGEIVVPLARAKFFRGYHHFFLLQRFGGVPIATIVPDLDSELLTAPRNSRYEVMAQVIADLEAAIPDLPRNSTIGANDIGKVSKEAAQALLSEALLYEATWEKYVGTSTDGDGTTEGAGSAKPAGYPSIDDMLQKSNTLAKDIMDNGGFELWDYNHIPEMKNWSNLYLFNLEDAGSNPAGLDKSSNKETILASKFDFGLYQGNTNIGHTVGGRLAASRYMMDMYLCSDGLPVDKSAVFMGYTGASDEYQNRDYLLTSYQADNDTWDIPEDGSIYLGGAGSGSGAGGRKFRSYNHGSYRNDRQESFDYPIIRYAEVLLIYAETLYEMNGSLTDAQLNESINLTKARAGLPPLTNAFAAANGLDIYEEIVRERTVELFAENTRYNDLKRWGIAEERLNDNVIGAVIEGTEFEGNRDLYVPEGYPYGELSIPTGVGMRRCLVLHGAADRSYAKTDYLFPIPLEQMNLNPNLKQNPGY